MSRPQDRSDWSDDRLDAAFQAHFDAELPPRELPDRIHEALAATSTGSTRPWRRWVALGVAPTVVALAVLAVGLGTLSIRPLPSTRQTDLPGAGGSPAPVATRVQGGGAMPETISVPGANEQPVLTVAEALAARSASVVGRELVVGGWYEMNPAPCAARPDATSDLEDCAADFTWLMDAPEILNETNGDGSGSIHPPAGPGIKLVTSRTNWTPPTSGEATRIVVIGHFDDKQAALCPAGERRTRCEGLFVIDAPLWTPEGAIDLAAAPPSVRGLDVKSVEEAIGVRDSGSGEQIAVAGWFSAPFGAFSCPMEPADGPTWLEGRCAAAMEWLLARPEGLINVGDQTSIQPPTGPAIQTAFENVPWPDGNGPPNLGSVIPMPAVFVGHFNDPRSSGCTGSSDETADAVRAACRARFVVDVVVWLNGSRRDISL